MVILKIIPINLLSKGYGANGAELPILVFTDSCTYKTQHCRGFSKLAV